MLGEQNLTTLLASMNPTLSDETYIFGHIPADSENASTQTYIQDLMNRKHISMIFWEKEGWSLIVPENEIPTQFNIQPVFRCKKITLNVHSSLDAVGFLAAITTRLKELRIGVNPVSGYFHDHLFVPVRKEDAVMQALGDMVEEAKN